MSSIVASCLFASIFKQDRVSHRKMLQTCLISDAILGVQDLLQDSPVYGLIGAEALTSVFAPECDYRRATLDQSNTLTHVEALPSLPNYQVSPSLFAR